MRGAGDLAIAQTPRGHALVEGNVRLWPKIVNAEKTAVVVKWNLRLWWAEVLEEENPTISFLDHYTKSTGRQNKRSIHFRRQSSQPLKVGFRHTIAGKPIDPLPRLITSTSSDAMADHLGSRPACYADSGRFDF
ncbi:hypothetical protein EN803_10000 [Mesorhizobium sp. M2D.F.Ca.ET.160.01.1.1]|nr:hypothetical protein EN803_10000 [Mesorhizobium sp. M2D.F.Ca.ET.160.01.1.1]